MGRMEAVKRRQSDGTFTIKYWSTRKKGDIIEPYGESHFPDIHAAGDVKDRLKKSKDIYRIEIWHLVSAEDREKVVEDFHGNPAHLSLENSRREHDNG